VSTPLKEGDRSRPDAELNVPLNHISINVSIQDGKAMSKGVKKIKNASIMSPFN
jgi:hypothetical protein